MSVTWKMGSSPVVWESAEKLALLTSQSLFRTCAVKLDKLRAQSRSWSLRFPLRKLDNARFPTASIVKGNEDFGYDVELSCKKTWNTHAQ